MLEQTHKSFAGYSPTAVFYQTWPQLVPLTSVGVFTIAYGILLQRNMVLVHQLHAFLLEF